jgi:hypothetical protein
MLYYPNCPGRIPAGLKGTRGAAYTATGLKVRPIPTKHVRGFYPFLEMHTRGLQFLKLNGNQTENDKYWQKYNFVLFAKCLKM